MSNKPEIVENRKSITEQLPEYVEEVLQSLFKDKDKVYVENEFSGGFAGAHVYLVHPLTSGTEQQQLRVVVKVGKRHAILQEQTNYDKYIKRYLPKTAEIDSNIGYSSDGQWAGIQYEVGGDPYPTYTLTEHLKKLVNKAGETEIVKFFDNNLFPIMDPWWSKMETDYAFVYAKSYDRILPVRFILEPLKQEATTTDFIEIDQTQRAYPNYDARLGQDAQIGDLLKISNFFVEEADHEKGELTLNLSLFHQRKDFLPSYRIRVRGLADLNHFTEGEQISQSIMGKVVETRFTALQRKADLFLGDQTNAECLTFDGETKLPNPLFKKYFSNLVNVSHHIGLTSVHGDFNLSNILIDQNGSPSIIDFADTRYDHVLHDLMRLETGVLTYILPEYLAENDEPKRIIHDLYANLHEPYQSANLSYRKDNPQLKKVFVIFQQIRNAVARLMHDKKDWSEYYDGLSLYLLSTLKFGNLKKIPHAYPLAFWGAATLQSFSNPTICPPPPPLPSSLPVAAFSSTSNNGEDQVEDFDGTPTKDKGVFAHIQPWLPWILGFIVIFTVGVFAFNNPLFSNGKETETAAILPDISTDPTPTTVTPTPRLTNITITPSATPTGAATETPTINPTVISAPPTPSDPTGYIKTAEEAINNFLSRNPENKLKIAVRNDTPLFGLLVEDTLVGFEIDLVKEMIKYWGINMKVVEFVQVSAEERIPTMVNRGADIGIFVLSDVDDRCDLIICTQTYFEDQAGLLVRRDSSIDDICDLDGQSVAVLAGTSGIKNILDEMPRWCDFETPPQPMIINAATADERDEEIKQAVNRGLPYTTDTLILQGKAEKYNKEGYDFVVLENVKFSAELYKMGVSPEQKGIKELINLTLQEMKDDGTYDALFEKWFGCDVLPYPIYVSNSERPSFIKQKVTQTSSNCSLPDPTPNRKGPITEDSYFIQPGDTLGEIAVRRYGSYNLYSCIQTENGFSNDDLKNLHPGQRLNLPDDCLLNTSS